MRRQENFLLGYFGCISSLLGRLWGFSVLNVLERVLLRFHKTIKIRITIYNMFHYLQNPQYPRFKNIIAFFYNYSDRLLEKDERCDSESDDTEWNVFDIQSFLDLY